MSCRVIGRKVETTFLTKILRDAKQQGVITVRGNYIPTKKNGLVKDFYPNHNFSNDSKEPTDGSSEWSINIESKELNYPDFIQIIED